MKKVNLNILTLSVPTTPLIGSTCFSNGTQTSFQCVPNQFHKKEFQFGKLLNKSKKLS